MGSHMKKSIFHEQTSKALKKWHMNVKKKQDESEKSSPQTAISETNSKKSTSPLKRHSSGPGPVPVLHRFMSVGVWSRASAYAELVPCDYDGEDGSTVDNFVVRVDNDRFESEMITLSKREESRVEWR